jgi:hypothetical protein
MGFSVSGMGIQVVENRFKKVSTGILLFVDLPGYGNAVGAVLEDNRFENV